MVTDDESNDCSDHEHNIGHSCSCAVALEIEQHGLFSTFHCRFTLDGNNCPYLDCPYSHVNVNGASQIILERALQPYAI